MSKNRILSNQIITSDVDYYVATTGDDVSGDGSLASPWASPHKAMDSLKDKMIMDGVTITVNIAAGAYTFSEPVRSFHQDGEKIKFIGADLLGNKPWGFPVGDYTPDPTSPTVPARGVDEFYNTAGTRPVDVALATIDSDRISDRTNNEALIRARYATQLEFTDGSSGFEAVDGGKIGLINKIAIIGDFSTKDTTYYPVPTSDGSPVVSSNRASGIFTANAGSVFVGLEVAIHGFGWAGIYAIENGYVFCDFIRYGSDGITITGCGYGIQSRGARVVAEVASVSGCTEEGIYTTWNGMIFCLESYVSGCDIGIRSAYNGSIRCQDAHVSGNSSHGLYADQGGILYAPDSQTEGNIEYGLYATSNASVYAAGIYCLGNGNSGVLSYRNSHVDIHLTLTGRIPIISYNVGYGVVASYEAHITAYGIEVKYNGLQGLYSIRGGNIQARCRVDRTHATYRTDIAYNGREQVYAWMGSFIDVRGAAITRDNGNSYAAVRSSRMSNIYLSSSSSVYYETDIYGTGTQARVIGFYSSHIYAHNTNLTPASASHFSPLGDTEGNILTFIDTN